MAQARLERVGSIYTRIKKLLEHKGIPKNMKPLWYDLYEAFPPKYEPCYDRPILSDKLKPIFYTEDKIRAKFHKQFGRILYFDLLEKRINMANNFFNIYNILKQKNYSEDELYAIAIKEFLNTLKSLKSTMIDIEFNNESIYKRPQKETEILLDEIQRNFIILLKEKFNQNEVTFTEQDLSQKDHKIYRQNINNEEDKLDLKSSFEYKKKSD